MIRPRIRTPFIHCLLAATLAATGIAPAVAQVETYVFDDFEDPNAPLPVPWTDILGCPRLELDSQSLIAGSQSLRMSPTCGEENDRDRDDDLLCFGTDRSSVMATSFMVDFKDLELPPGSSFEIFGLFEYDWPERQALTVKIGRNDFQLWVRIETVDDGGNLVTSQHHSLERILQRGTVLGFSLMWQRGKPSSSEGGVASLEVVGKSSSFSLEVSGLENHTLEPDYIRVGYGEAEFSDQPGGSFLLDEFELRTMP